jgi:hypothetical protein
MQHGFTEEEHEQYIQALNFIANHARFGEAGVDLKFILAARNHFSRLQSIGKKIEERILEVKAVHDLKDNRPTDGE